MTNFQYDFKDNIITARALDYLITDQYGMGHAIFYSMKRYKNKTAQIDGSTGEKQSYSSLLNRSIRTAFAMRAKGIKSRDIISICSYNHLDSSVPLFAALFLGAQVASLDPSISSDDTIHLLKQVRPNMIFVSDNAVDLIENAAETVGLVEMQLVVFGDVTGHNSFDDFASYECKEDLFEPVKVDDRKTAIIFFSSGTTGLPKGIELSHYSLLIQGLLVKEEGFDCTAALWYASVYWVSSILLIVSTTMIGGCRIMAKEFNTDDYWSMINDFKVTFSFMAPPQAIKILKAGRPEGFDTTSLMDLVIGGGPLSTESLALIRDIFPGSNLHLVYGLTEVGGSVTIFKPASREELVMMLLKENSSGRPVPGFSCKVVDDDTKEILGPYQNGELRIKTNYSMNGYHNMDSSNAWDADGWLCTGDVVYYDNDFCFFIVDRVKEMLKFQSWHIPPTKIEDVLLTHPGVGQVIVIGVPDEDDGDHPLAVVVKNEDSDVTAEELIQYVAERVDDRQRLRGGVVFMDQLPYTPSGKVKRKIVKEMIYLQLSKNT